MAAPQQVPLPGCWSLLTGRIPSQATGSGVSWDDVQALNLPTIGEISTPLYVVALTEEGALLKHARPGQRAADRVSAPLVPARALPPVPGGFRDRDAELRILRPALSGGRFVVLQGPPGIGKTELIRHIMHDLSPNDFPAGMVYLSARGETYRDLLQELFESLFELNGSVLITEEEFGRRMAGRRALIAIDDADDLGPRAVEALAQVVPDSAILVAARSLLATGALSIPLRGLPGDEAVALFEQHWEAVTAQELPLVEDICTALGNVPLAIISTAKAASSQNLPLTQVVQQVQPAPVQSDPVRQAFAFVAGGLSDDEKQVLGGLVAADGLTAGDEAISAITGLPLDLVRHCLDALEQEGLVSISAGRYRMDEAFARQAQSDWTTGAMESRAADYYRRQAHHLTGPFKDPDEDNVMAALEFYFQRGAWIQVGQIANALEPYLAMTGRWEHWRMALDRAWRGAREQQDVDAEARIQNQLGVLSAAQGARVEASRFFDGALGHWRRFGSTVGSTLAGWNGDQNLWNTAHALRRSAPHTLVALLLAAVLVILLVILARLALRPPPEVTLTLVAGCDRTYHPGDTLDISVWSNVSGDVELRWVDPFSREDHLFRERIQAEQEIRKEWPAPAIGGNWLLAAYLNDGQAVDHCSFAIDPETTVLYDFVREASAAEWIVYSPAQQSLTWTDSSTLPLGFAGWREDVILEDGRVVGRVLETRPPLAPGGEVWGRYDLSAVTLQPGDRFAARVGFLKGCRSGSVTYSIRYDSGDPDAPIRALASQTDACDGPDVPPEERIKVWRIPIPHNLAATRFYLEVEAGLSPVGDQPAWIEARIERPTP